MSFLLFAVGTRSELSGHGLINVNGRKQKKAKDFLLSLQLSGQHICN